MSKKRGWELKNRILESGITSCLCTMIFDRRRRWRGVRSTLSLDRQLLLFFHIKKYRKRNEEANHHLSVCLLKHLTGEKEQQPRITAKTVENFIPSSYSTAPDMDLHHTKQRAIQD